MRKLKLEELGRISTTEFKAAEKIDIIVLLDNIRSGLNVGSIFRTSDAFRIKKIILSGITAQPPHREVLKTAIGATDSVDWEYINNPIDAIQKLKQDNWQVIAIEQTDNSISLEDFIPKKNEKYLLIFGNEVGGVSDELLSLVDAAIEIPQYGTKHSLNVAVCYGITIWDINGKLKPSSA
jgi:tRNA G18 (ribose-2'-O)-methylase SpoU